MAREIPWNLIQKYLAGRATSAEKEKLYSWRLEDPENERLLEELNQIWSIAPEQDYEVDVQKAWERFERRTSSPVSHLQAEDYNDRVRDYEKHWIKEKQIYGVAVAALVLIAVSLGIAFNEPFSDSTDAPSRHKQVMAMKVLNTKPGERAEVSFSDGTRIILNADSRLRFPRSFKKRKRVVYLNGEAYFEVASNKELPFIVHTNSAKVKVLGTKFNVQAWQEDDRVSVSVKEGRVSVQKSDTSQSADRVTLKKYQNAIVESGQEQIAVETLESNKFLYWLNGGLYFHNTPFPNVIKRLERKYKVDIQIRDQKLTEYRYSGAFQKVDLEEALNVISMSMDVVFKQQENRILVKAKQVKK